MCKSVNVQTKISGHEQLFALRIECQHLFSNRLILASPLSWVQRLVQLRHNILLNPNNTYRRAECCFLSFNPHQALYYTALVLLMSMTYRNHASDNRDLSLWWILFVHHCTDGTKAGVAVRVVSRYLMLFPFILLSFVYGTVIDENGTQYRSAPVRIVVGCMSGWSSSGNGIEREIN